MLEEPGVLWAAVPSQAPLPVALVGTGYLKGGGGSGESEEAAAALTAALGHYPGRTQRALSRLLRLGACDPACGLASVSRSGRLLLSCALSSAT